jgi:hypothetical protein
MVHVTYTPLLLCSGQFDLEISILTLNLIFQCRWSWISTQYCHCAWICNNAVIQCNTEIVPSFQWPELRNFIRKLLLGLELPDGIHPLQNWTFWIRLTRLQHSMMIWMESRMETSESQHNPQLGKWIRLWIQGGNKYGLLWIFLPKFHCELNFIEFFWGAVNKYLRENCDYTFDTLKENMPKALESVSIMTIRRWEDRMYDMYHWMEAYWSGLGTSDAQLQVKKFCSASYKSHRRIPETLYSTSFRLIIYIA